jgi:RNA polymerase sigma-70 factor (ECF subfamily)
MTESAQDLALMERLAAGDHQALKVLFMRYRLQVFRFVGRIVRNDAVAEEQTNEVFLDVWRNVGTFQGQSSPCTWILAIARNKAYGAIRRRREESLDEDEGQELADEGFDPEGLAMISDKALILRRCIDALPLEQRMIVDLVYYHELPVAEVSAVACIPEGTVKTRLFNARKRLSTMLLEAGVDREWP